jgi:hypothetical protein
VKSGGKGTIVDDLKRAMDVIGFYSMLDRLEQTARS